MYLQKVPQFSLASTTRTYGTSATTLETVSFVVLPSEHSILEDPSSSIQSTSSPALPPASHHQSSIREFIKTLPRTQRRLLDGLEQVGMDVQVFRAFRARRKLYRASDGGLSDDGATHGWILSIGKQVLYRCSGPVDGPVDTNSSTRSELGGCASALLLLVSLSTHWGMQHNCSFQWFTDSRSATSEGA